MTLNLKTLDTSPTHLLRSTLTALDRYTETDLTPAFVARLLAARAAITAELAHRGERPRWNDR